MKSYARYIIPMFVLMLASSVPSFAQYTTYLRLVELDPYTQINMNVDSEVILLKSTRDHITFAGDSTFIASINVSQDESVLSFNYEKEPESKLIRVVIEYKNINTVTTGGNGTYYFHKLNEDNLSIRNPHARIHLNGDADNLTLVSVDGINDVTALNADKMFVQIGEKATLINREDRTVLSALN